MQRPRGGRPDQYDELRSEHDEGAVEIVVYNRAILLFFTDTEAVRRIHREPPLAPRSTTSGTSPSREALCFTLAPPPTLPART